MSAGVQSVVVALAVLTCACYSIWRLLSARLRLRLLAWCAALPGIGSTAWLHALRARALSKLAAGGCASCAPSATGAASQKQTPGALRR